MLFDIEKLEENGGDRYNLILVAVKRIHQLHMGAKPLVDIQNLKISKLIDIALAEIQEGKVNKKGEPTIEESTPQP